MSSSATRSTTPLDGFDEDETDFDDSFLLKSANGLEYKPSPAPDSDELARFREEWKSEVRRRNHLDFQDRVPSSIHSPSPLFGGPSGEPSYTTQGSFNSSTVSGPPYGTFPPLNVIQSANFVYTEPKHFMLDAGAENQDHNDFPLSGASLKFMETMGLHVSSTAICLTGPLKDIIKDFPHDLGFEPLDDTQPVLISLLPTEVLLYTLHLIDHTTLEMMALVNRKFRLLSLETSIWRDFVSRAYKPPQIKSMDDLPELLDRFSWDYRKMYIEQPRLRTDGVYISLNQYVRRVDNRENPWSAVEHLITYYRYLRFFPNGQVLHLLVQGGENRPDQIIPLLKPALQMKDLQTGQWTLTESQEVHLVDLVDASGTTRLPVGLTLPFYHGPLANPKDDVLKDLRYAFTMTLSLKSKPVIGRWNRLDLMEYESVNLENGDKVPISFGKEKPFWFSRVRSYA